MRINNVHGDPSARSNAQAKADANTLLFQLLEDAALHIHTQVLIAGDFNLRLDDLPTIETALPTEEYTDVGALAGAPLPTCWQSPQGTHIGVLLSTEQHLRSAPTSTNFNYR